MAVTDVPLTLGIGLTLALLVSDRIELGGLAAGLATSLKYPGVLLLVPLVVAGYRQPRRVAVGAALAAVAFCATSPFFVAHLGSAISDAYRVQKLAHQGWLGFEHDHVAPIAFIVELWHGLGPALLVCALGLVVALVQRKQADLILASFAIVYFVDISTFGAHFDRYVLPLLLPLGALAGRLRALAPVTLLLLVVPLTWAVRDARKLTKTDTRVVAHDWVESHLPQGSRIAVDPSLTPFEGFRVLQLQLPLPEEKRPDPNRYSRILLDKGIRYVIVTGAVEDRVLAAPETYPAESDFFNDLDSRGKRLFYRKEDGLNGPWVAVYRI
jgi:hypothetical protein